MFSVFFRLYDTGFATVCLFINVLLCCAVKKESRPAGRLSLFSIPFSHGMGSSRRSEASGKPYAEREFARNSPQGVGGALGVSPQKSRDPPAAFHFPAPFGYNTLDGVDIGFLYGLAQSFRFQPCQILLPCRTLHFRQAADPLYFASPEPPGCTCRSGQAFPARMRKYESIPPP